MYMYMYIQRYPPVPPPPPSPLAVVREWSACGQCRTSHAAAVPHSPACRNCQATSEEEKKWRNQVTVGSNK